MKQTIRLTKAELRRLLMNKKTYIMMAISIFVISLGFIEFIRTLGDSFFNPSRLSTLDNVVFPFSLGTLGGSLIWGIAIILDSDRVVKNRAKDMINAFTDEKRTSLARIYAYSIIIGITFLISLLVYLPICYKRMDYLFSYQAYVIYPLIMVIPGCIMTLFICDGLYKISQNLSVSIFLFLILTIAQFTSLLNNNFFLRWNSPIAPDISDAFGSPAVIRLLLYSRVLLLAGALFFWNVSCLFIRKYQYGIFRSFLLRVTRPAAVIIPVGFAAITVIMAMKQPFVDHSPIISFDDSAYLESFTRSDHEASYARYKTTLNFNTLLGTVKGVDECLLTEALDDQITFHLGAGYRIKSMTLDDQPIEYESFYDMEDGYNTYFGNKKYIIKNPEKKKGMLKIVYEGYPSLSRSLFYSGGGYQNGDVVGRDYISLSWQHQGAEYDYLGGPEKELYVNVPKNHIPLIEANEMKRVKDNDDGTVCWKINYYVGNLFSGSYKADKISYSKRDVYFKYSNKYADTVKAYKLDEAINSVLDYCDNHVGELDTYDYEDQPSPDIRILQTSADSTGGYAGDGAVVMNEHFLSPQTLSDSKAGTNMSEVFMHEIIHLYWGDLGLLLDDDGLWSPEGLTVFTTYRIVKEKYGELYAKQYYVDKWKEDVKYLNNNFYYRHPEYIDKLPAGYRSAIETNVSSIKRYSLMPLMLLKAEEKLGGEKEMDKVMQEMYSNKMNYVMNDSYFTFQDFLDISGLTEEDLKVE